MKTTDIFHETSSAVELKNKHKAADSLVDDIEGKIFSGNLKYNTRLPAERQLTKHYGVSRTVVREAIKELSNRGLLKVSPNCRPIVQEPTYNIALDSFGKVFQHLLRNQNGIKNLFHSRIFLEKSLVRYAAHHAKKEDIQRLQNALENNRNAIGDSEAFYQTDADFHKVLYQLPNNPIFNAIHDIYTTWLSFHWLRMVRTKEENEVDFALHKKIFTAISERDADMAEELLSNHLNYSWSRIMTKLEHNNENFNNE